MSKVKGRRLHHVGIAVKDISTAADEYSKRPGYRIASTVIHDPVQTAFVQFIETKGDTIFLEIVSPDGPDSKLTNAVKNGGGLNHLCYTVNDIEKECAELRMSGMFILQPPVEASAFPGRRIAWLMGHDGIPIELVENGIDNWLSKEDTN
jgi:methylmalonyl-CoA/ethylmalonyl-CoA epimerase